MDDKETLDDVIENLTTEIKETLGNEGCKISAKWSWGDEYHVYWDNGWLRNQVWMNYILIVSPQIERDSGSIRKVCVSVYNPKIKGLVKEAFEKYKEENAHTRVIISTC